MGSGSLMLLEEISLCCGALAVGDGYEELSLSRRAPLLGLTHFHAPHDVFHIG